jgi:hypothetical protein
MKKTPMELWGMQVLFMKLDKDHLAVSDQYRSKWITDTKPELPKVVLGGKGELVLGLFGRQGLNTDAIGLLLKDPKAAAAKATPETDSSGEISAEALQKEDEASANDADDEPQAAATTKPAVKGINLLNRLQGNLQKNEDGTVHVPRRSRLSTPNSYRTPATFTFVCKSDTKDFRIGYGADQIIFNWEMRPDDLRVDGGPISGGHREGFGRLPSNRWVTIEMAYRPRELTISVNGKVRYRASGDFSQVNQPFTITAHNGDLELKSLTVAK